MYRLTFLYPDTFNKMEYPGNPWDGTIPELVNLIFNGLGHEVSESTVRRSFYKSGSFAKSLTNDFGVPILVVVANLPK